MTEHVMVIKTKKNYSYLQALYAQGYACVFKNADNHILTSENNGVFFKAVCNI